MKRLAVLRTVSFVIMSIYILFAYQNCSPTQFKLENQDQASTDLDVSGQGNPPSVVNPGNPFVVNYAGDISSPLQCQNSNELGIGLEMDRSFTYECSDVSYIDPAAKAGLTCTEGVEVPSSIKTNSTWVRCEDVTICGQRAKSVKSIGSSSNNSDAFELVYSNLPWGCKGQIDVRYYRNDQEGPKIFNASLKIQSGVPTCKTCEGGAKTCGTCDGSPKSCVFNGQVIGSGMSVTAYLSSSVPFGQSCRSEVRSCSNGKLSGSFSYKFCSVESPKSCTTSWGAVVPHGASVTGYKQGVVMEPMACEGVKGTSTCQNGVLSGDAAVSSCTQSSFVCPKLSTVKGWGGWTFRPTQINGQKGYVKGVGYCLYEGDHDGDPFCTVTDFNGTYVSTGKYCNDPYKISKFKVALYNWDRRAGTSLPCDAMTSNTLSANQARCYRGFSVANIQVKMGSSTQSICTGEKGNKCKSVTTQFVRSVQFDCTDGEQVFSCEARKSSSGGGKSK